MNVDAPMTVRKAMEPEETNLESDEKIVLYSIGALRNTPLRGKVKLQKLLFLITEVFPEWDEFLEYDSHLLGPYSERVDNILEDLMTQEQAQMAAALPGTAKEVAGKTGFKEDKVKEELDSLFLKTR